MKATHLIFHILFGLILTACDAVVDEPLPEHEPKLVLNGYLQPDRPIEVYLSRSYGLLERIDSVGEILITDANVELLSEGQLLSTMTYRDTLIDQFFPFFGKTGKYSAEGFVGESGKTYTVRASRNGYEPIEATTTLPSLANILTAEIEQNVARPRDAFDDFSSSQSLLKVTVDDPPQEENYYSFELTIWYSDSIFPQRQQAFIFVEGLARPSDNGGFTADETIISDADFDGQIHTLDLLIQLPNAYLGPDEIYNLDIEAIVLQTTTSNADYARYKLDEQKQNRSGGFDFFPPESVVVYDNVENGFGILGGFVVSRDSIVQ